MSWEGDAIGEAGQGDRYKKSSKASKQALAGIGGRQTNRRVTRWLADQIDVIECGRSCSSPNQLLELKR